MVISMLAQEAVKAIEAAGDVKKGKWGKMKKAFGGLSGLDLKSLISFVMNLKIVQFVLKPINAIFKVFVNAIMKPLFPVVEPLVKAMMDMMPLFEQLGTLIGEGIADAVKILMPFFEKLGKVFIEEVMPAIMEIAIEFKVFIPLLIELLPLLMLLVQGLVLVVRGIKILVGWIFGHSPGLIPAFAQLIEIITPLIILFHEGLLVALDALKDIIIVLAPLISAVLIESMKMLVEIAQIVADSISDVTLLVGQFNEGLTTLESILDIIINSHMDAFNLAMNLIITVIEGIGDAVCDMLGCFEDFIDLIDDVLELATELVSLVNSIGGGDGGGLGDIIGDLLEDLGIGGDNGGNDDGICIGDYCLPGAQSGMFTGGEGGPMQMYSEGEAPTGIAGGKQINININLKDAVIADEYSITKLGRKLHQSLWMELGG